jgi:aspartyl-tRNA(Asn)/glutamyl-tRNA(Gln) amidotransferase subunit A
VNAVRTRREWTLAGAARAVREGEVTAAALVEQSLAAAEHWDPTIGALVARYDESAREAAAAADAARSAGVALGPLHGVPVGIKDIIATREGPTRAQSLVADPEWELGRDAPAVARLRDAGAIIVGKTSTMEFAAGLPEAAKPFPVPLNPWDPSRYTGGSSSGSAGGVAAGMFLGALGTDTGGSIRIPSAFCGVSGLKPTFGRVPKSGCLPLGYSLDHIGPIAPGARDCALLLEAMAGPDPNDPGSSDLPVGDLVAALGEDLDGLRIGVDRLAEVAPEHLDPAVLPALEAALTTLTELGAEIVPIELPLYDELTTADIVVLVSEAAAFHMNDMRSRWEEYTRGMRAIVGSYSLYTGADYVQAQRVRDFGRRTVDRLMAEQELDAIVTPTLGLGAVPIGEAEDVALGAKWRAIFVMYWNATGHPVLTVPIGYDGASMPLAMQIAGRHFDEAIVLRVGDAYQSRTDWHLRAPVLMEAP